MPTNRKSRPSVDLGIGGETVFADLRTQPARTIVKAACEGHPVTFHRNCIRENPYYVPRSTAGAAME